MVKHNSDGPGGMQLPGLVTPIDMYGTYTTSLLWDLVVSCSYEFVSQFLSADFVKPKLHRHLRKMVELCKWALLKVLVMVV